MVVKFTFSSISIFKMIRLTRHITFILLFILINGNHQAQQVTITVTGSWSLTIGSSDLQGGAGSDLNSTYQSATNQVSINIDKVVNGNFWDWFVNYNWRVDVEKQDTNWDSRLQLWVHRSGNGFGFGSISGGTNYQQVTNSTTSFFSGSRRRFWITIQYELRNVSVQVPVDTYSTLVIYTVTEL